MNKHPYRHLITGIDKGFTSCIAIKSTGGTPTISVNSKVLSLSDASSSILINMSGKSSEDVVSIINRSGLLFSAKVLFYVEDFADFDVLYSGAQAIDGSYLIKVPGHCIKDQAGTKIRLVDMYSYTRDEPWNPIISKGSLSYIWRNKRYVYGLPEWSKQKWSSKYGAGYVDIYDEVAEIIDDKGVIRVSRPDILWRNKNIKIRVNGIDYGAKFIKDVDQANSLIYLNRSIDSNDVVSVDYTYYEPNYIYKDVDMNPSEFHTPAILGEYVTIYALPSLYPNGEVRSSTINHSIGNTFYGSIVNALREDEPVLFLGTIHVSGRENIKNVSLIDTRSPGGGLREDAILDSLKKNKCVYSITDYGNFDGKPFPGNMTVVIKIPRTVKDTMEEKDITEALNKFIALGSYIFIEYE